MQAPTKCDSAFPLPICAFSQKSSDIASAACLFPSLPMQYDDTDLFDQGGIFDSRIRQSNLCEMN